MEYNLKKDCKPVILQLKINKFFKKKIKNIFAILCYTLETNTIL